MVNSDIRRFLPAGLCVVASLVLLLAPVSGFQNSCHSHGHTNVNTRTCETQIALWMSHSHFDNDSEDDEAHADDDSLVNESIPTSRRSLLKQTVTATGTAAALASLSLMVPQPAGAVTSSLPSTTTTAKAATTNPSDAVVTHKVFMNVRISRQDGTFYVRDDLPDIPENKVFSGRLVLGLFGQNAPATVERFLSYIPNAADDDVDNPLPSYARSSFNSFDDASGLLRGGKIASLEVTEIGGSTAIRYGGRLLPASLWIEGRGGTKATAAAQLPPRVSHIAKGLLTHRILDVTPEFSITTRSDTTVLDGSQTVFGQLQIDDVSKEFLTIVKDLPTYKVDRAAKYMPSSTGTGTDNDSDKGETIVDEAAQAIFDAQRAFFRKAAKQVGDTRIEKVFEGKLLRRVEVTQVGLM
jgi:cyclophilin family peptidyl-prolyl cis-trans isomerase